MPVMDGLQATEAIRADSRIPAIYQPCIVALTANASVTPEHPPHGAWPVHGMLTLRMLLAMCVAVRMQGDKERCIEAGMDSFTSKVRTCPVSCLTRDGRSVHCSHVLVSLVSCSCVAHRAAGADCCAEGRVGVHEQEAHGLRNGEPSVPGHRVPSADGTGAGPRAAAATSERRRRGVWRVTAQKSGQKPGHAGQAETA